MCWIQGVVLNYFQLASTLWVDVTIWHLFRTVVCRVIEYMKKYVTKLPGCVIYRCWGRLLKTIKYTTFSAGEYHLCT